MKAFWIGLLAVAALIELAVLASWFLLGAHTGWTQTKLPHTQIDPVTEIEFVQYQDGFRPGLDFLVAGLLLGSGLAAAALLFPRILAKS
ncbi:MAG: hypothetical protein OHK005_06170 [Candidatus Methylacidiphilales bacterium]